MNQPLTGTMCDDSFGEVDAEVACRDLGFSRGEVLDYDDDIEGGKGPIWLDEVQCDDQKEKLIECNQDGWEEHDCDHSEDVRIRCFNNECDTEGALQLQDGDDENEGRLEICHDDQWGRYTCIQALYPVQDNMALANHLSTGFIPRTLAKQSPFTPISVDLDELSRIHSHLHLCDPSPQLETS